MVLRGQASVKGLSGSEITLKGATIASLEIISSSGLGLTCAECMREVREGEEVFVVSKSVVNEDQTIIVNKDSHVVHLKGRSEGSCLEEFIARVISNTEPESVEQSSTQTKATAADDKEEFPD